jgi:hypothetical protein
MNILIIIIIAFFIFIIFYFILHSQSEHFTDKIKYEQSKILFERLKNNKLDFDRYKKKLKEHPNLIDVTIYDKIKHISNFTVDNIYDVITH